MKLISMCTSVNAMSDSLDLVFVVLVIFHQPFTVPAVGEVVLPASGDGALDKALL